MPLVRKSGKSGGTLNVALTFTPSGAPGHGAPPPAYAYGAPSKPYTGSCIRHRYSLCPLLQLPWEESM